MDRKEKLELFRGMIQCCHNLYLWTYDRALELMDSNCPDEALVSTLFAAGNHREVLSRHAEANRDPILLSNSVNMMWIAVPDWEAEALRFIHVLGPFFTDDRSIHTVEEQLRRMNLSISLQRQSMDFLRSLPIISMNRIFEYAIMLCYLVSSRRIAVSDIHYQEAELLRPADALPEAQTRIHGTYEMEQEMLRMVREGNLNYQDQLNRLSLTGTQGRLSNGEPMRQQKNAVLVCIILFSRAAIEGGLSPEVSYTLTDHYFQSVEASKTISELTEVSKTMQEDFVLRVHRCRQDTGRSRAIRDCCDYIDLHLEEKLTLADLADMLGYSEYYFSKKFKREVGITPKEYIRRQRLERAKLLLRTSQDSVQTISERLQFCSLSYFSESFRKSSGITPSQFRDQSGT